MKLSEAILLGDTLKRCDPKHWISEDGGCGCALGGALLAVGADMNKLRAEYEWNTFRNCPEVKKYWPWLTADHTHKISELYRGVASGDRSIEDVAAYVREIEPEEKPTLTDELIGAVRNAEQLSGIERPEDSDPGDEQEDLGGYHDPAEDRRFA